MSIRAALRAASRLPALHRTVESPHGDGGLEAAWPLAGTCVQREEEAAAAPQHPHAEATVHRDAVAEAQRLGALPGRAWTAAC